ncbi:hypothetical protein MBANPS3_002871 [Mucor bainieri]
MNAQCPSNSKTFIHLLMLSDLDQHTLVYMDTKYTDAFLLCLNTPHLANARQDKLAYVLWSKQDNINSRRYESFVQNDAKSAGRPLKEEGLLKELKAVSAKLETLQGLGSVNSGSNMKKGGNDVLANLLLTVQKLIKSLLEGLGGERRRRGEKEPSVHSYRKDKSDKNKLETKFEDT